MVTCGNCGAENAYDHAFCSSCGSALARSCPNCGTQNEAANKFCFNCGASLAERASAEAAGELDPVADPGERRLVSVLFADLVGFTTFSEGRDPEDVRGMLTNFYERCREIIGRYGGTTDKFIGDAVMGVWGAKGAHEDDAERATRAGLELVDMVAGLGHELGIDALAARAGVLSGEASVGSGGNEQGLVVGDLVNTASRVQSIAKPGTVYVGSGTRDLVGSAIEFRSVGTHDLKGKAQSVEVFEATRVLALSTAQAGVELLEGPFVGRDDELRLLKDQLHATGRESRARMVTVIGEGGIGKSRLSTELIRYIDGLTEVFYYHRGRSPSYGDGVTFWALGEMIRQRAGISEGEDPAKARLKLRTTVAEFSPAEEDQRWIEPRVSSVLGLTDSPPGDRAEYFAALRAFFQSISARGTVLMVFEDLHWADDGLLDFVEEMVDRTTSNPVLVLCLARPELLERRPDWAVSRKRSLSMHLSRLDGGSMNELVSGLAPGMSDVIVDRIVDRAAGVPLHAVEFVRMLLNTGQLVREGSTYRFEGDEAQLPIPDSVNAIIGARLDRLDTEAQSLIKDASILGLTFPLSSLTRLRGQSNEDVSRSLGDLVRREVLEFDENPRSPERGQYRFVQGLIREVAYGRLSRQERVSRHLAAAEMYEASNDPELAGVIASHYADAIGADPQNEELAQKACASVIEAAERASNLKANGQAASLYERAAQMTAEPQRRNELLLEAADCLFRTGREDRGADLAREVIAWAQENRVGSVEERAVTILANILSANFLAGEAAEAAIEVYSRVPKRDDVMWAQLAQATSRALMLADRADEAIAVADESLPVMEKHEMTEALLDTLINKGTSHFWKGDLIQGAAVLRGVADLASDRDFLVLRLRALNNLVAASQYDKFSDSEMSAELDGLVEKLGQESWSLRSNFFSAWTQVHLGRPGVAAERLRSSEDFDMSEFWMDSYEIVGLSVELLTGGIDESAVSALEAIYAKYLDVDDPQLRDSVVVGKAWLLLQIGRLEEALTIAKRHQDLVANYPQAAQVAIMAAAQLDQRDVLVDVLARLDETHPRGRASRGLASAGRAYVAGRDGDLEAAERAFLVAEDLWAKTNSPLNLAYARAVFGIVVGTDNEFAAVKAHEARAFFEEAGYQLNLDGVMSELGVANSAPDAIASGG